MRIAVGTENPVKVAAVQTAVERIWSHAVVQCASVRSGVSDMPFGDEVCITGARNRATAVQSRYQADFGVGLEGGVQELATGLFLCGWVVVVAADGREGIGSSGKIQLPTDIANQVRAGTELGLVMDAQVQEQNTKQKMGAIGLLTAGQISRKDSFATAVLLAFARFLTPHLYR